MPEIKLPKAYQQLLKTVLKDKKSGQKIDAQYWHKLQINLEKDQQLNLTESRLVINALQRDLAEAHHVFKAIGNAIANWVSFDAAVIEDKIEDWIALVADDTEVDWLLLGKQWNERDQYQSGELVGSGSFKCNECNFVLSYSAAASLPLCPQCKNSVFTKTTKEND